LAALLVVCSATSMDGQGIEETGAEGSPAAALAGASLGLLSGAMLGTTGSIVPCTQTYSGPRCVRWSAAIGGTVGLTSGLLVGAADEDDILGRLGSAGIGAAVGVAGALAVRPIIQRFGWKDVATVGLLGASIGASPKGAAIGFGSGALIGVVLWQAAPGFEVPDAFGAALGGLALGAVTDWVVRAIDAQSSGEAAFVVPLRVGF
jgi:hypothetical protein